MARVRINKRKLSNAGRVRPADSGSSPAGAPPKPLPRSLIRELRRRSAEMDDPTRYLIVSGLSRRFQLYYSVDENVYVMNEPKRGTLFKSRPVALAVARVLGPHIRVVRCRTRLHRGRPVLVVRSVRRVATLDDGGGRGRSA